MAYMDQEKKRTIMAELRKVMPKGWLYTVGVRNHSTIKVTILKAPFDLLGAFKPGFGCTKPPTYVNVNPYHYRSHIEDECVADVFEAIFRALNTGNWDNSDSQTDYFDVGHYVDVSIGRWDKQFVVSGPLADTKNFA